MKNFEKNRLKLQSTRFLRNRCAVSVALTSLIITASVIAAGISVLYWAYSWGDIANQQYSQTVNSNQNATSEKLAFEFTTYSSGTLKVYLLNCGQVNEVAVARVIIWDSSSQIVGTYPADGSAVTLMDSSIPGTPIAGNNLDVGKEGYFTVNPNLSAGYYTLRVVTERGRNFDTAINVQ